jgi:hypothetical protein
MSNLYAFMDGLGGTAVGWIRPDEGRFRWTCECQATGTADTATDASFELDQHRQAVHLR